MATSLSAEQREGISSYLATQNHPRTWARLTTAGSRVQQHWHERHSRDTACRASDNPEQTQLVPVPAQGSASRAAGVSTGCSPVDAGWQATGKMTRHFFQTGAGIPPAGSHCPPSATAVPGSQGACGQERREGQTVNESPSANTDAHRRGLWQKCSSCYTEPFTAGTASVAGLCGMDALPACSDRGWEGKPWGEVTTSEGRPQFHSPSDPKLHLH